ncbi:FMN reductase [Streptomyces coelicoflavus]|uniref:FMN reductase n=1 Tax=Streptomyces coelicoflavus TaxID=285562 RepID=A0A7K3PE64_9ACTN|nr:FMN reductase [Streptomyces coelicoflavus]NEB08187.1 FMN reductase [Streptomyces coelicoflavus]
MKLVVVSAGLSVPSSTRLLGDRLAAVAAPAASAPEPAPADVQVIELRDLAVEIAHTFTNGFPAPALADAFAEVAAADGLIVVTPVFSASYSGLFKSFFDALSVTDEDALTGKPVLIAATGGTGRHSLVLDHALRPLFAHLKAVVVPTGVYAASEDWGAEGLDARIGRAGTELAALMAGLSGSATVRRPPRRDSFEEVTPFEQRLAALSVPGPSPAP